MCTISPGSRIDCSTRAIWMLVDPTPIKVKPLSGVKTSFRTKVASVSPGMTSAPSKARPAMRARSSEASALPDDGELSTAQAGRPSSPAMARSSRRKMAHSCSEGCPAGKGSMGVRRRRKTSSPRT